MITKAQSLLPDGYKLLYLTKFGSHLYGTNTDKSDTDYKGIYLPSIEDIVLGKAKHAINISTGSQSSRNTSEDVDISLFSIQHFLGKLSSGEINALDILFSMFTTSYLHIDQQLRELIVYRYKDFLCSKTKAYTGYCMQQASKYGIKGSRYGDLIKMDEFLSEWNEENLKELTVRDLLDQGLPDLTYVSEIEKDNLKYIQVLGKLHQDNVNAAGFHKRIKNEMNKYGDRSKLSVEGVDWKALSHAYRACLQALELLQTGFIKFPLKEKARVKEIKYTTDISKLEPILDEIASLLTQIETTKTKLKPEVDQTVVNKTILQFYNL